MTRDILHTVAIQEGCVRKHSSVPQQANSAAEKKIKMKIGENNKDENMLLEKAPVGEYYL